MEAKEFVIEAGYADEIDWQDQIDFEDITETIFLREAAWVVLSAGFRESVVRRIFPRFSTAFLDWADATTISSRIDECQAAAMKVFESCRKISAIASIATRVAAEGFESIKMAIAANGVNYISEFPFMGPITSLHLAKNIGVPVAKPDRHLMRIATAMGYTTAHEACEDISKVVGDTVPVVDVVLWRFATLRTNYVEHFLAPPPAAPRELHRNRPRPDCRLLP